MKGLHNCLNLYISSINLFVSVKCRGEKHQPTLGLNEGCVLRWDADKVAIMVSLLFPWLAWCILDSRYKVRLCLIFHDVAIAMGIVKSRQVKTVLRQAEISVTQAMRIESFDFMRIYPLEAMLFKSLATACGRADLPIKVQKITSPERKSQILVFASLQASLLFCSTSTSSPTSCIFFQTRSTSFSSFKLSDSRPPFKLSRSLQPQFHSIEPHFPIASGPKNSTSQSIIPETPSDLIPCLSSPPAS